jgi:hypothetical protein
MSDDMTTPIQVLLENFAKVGPNIDSYTLKEILTRKKESLPYLIQIVEDEKYWISAGKEYSTWTPVSAIHLLSLIGGYSDDAADEGYEDKQEEEEEAILMAVEKAIKRHYDDVGDWLTEDMPSILAAFGHHALDTFAAMIADQKLDVFVRVGVARSLLMMSNSNPAIRKRSIQVLRDAISDEKDAEARSGLVNELAEFKDYDSLSFIESLFNIGLIDESIVTLNEVFDVYAGKFDELRYNEVRNPLDIFKDDPNNFYKTSNIVGHSLTNKENKSGKEARITGYSQKKVGRNDPCPCGSGKKYKKCCLH